mgnify:CR=1 FL=1
MDVSLRGSFRAILGVSSGSFRGILGVSSGSFRGIIRVYWGYVIRRQQFHSTGFNANITSKTQTYYKFTGYNDWLSG